MIRPDRQADASALLALWKVLGAGITPDDLAAARAQMAADPAYGTLVYQLDDQVVGFITFVRVFAVGMPRGYLKINGLAVLPQYQGQGIGRALMEAAEQWGRAQGLSRVILNSGVRRENAHAFYHHLGYARDSWCFDKNL